MKKITTTIASLTVLLLAGCGGGQQPITADDTNSATAASTKVAAAVDVDKEGVADVCSNVDPATYRLPADLAAAYSKEEVAAAVCEVLRFQYEVGWTNFANPDDSTIRESSGQAVVETVRPWVTAAALADVERLAVRAAKGDGAAEEDLMGVTVIDLVNPDWRLRAQTDDGVPIVGGREWSDPTFGLDDSRDAAGRERVDVTVDFIDDLLLARKSDGKPGSVKFRRRITYAMSQTGDSAHPWVVDSWTVDWKAGTAWLDDVQGKK